MKKYVWLVTILICWFMAGLFSVSTVLADQNKPALAPAQSSHDQAVWPPDITATTLTEMSRSGQQLIPAMVHPGAYQRLLEYLEQSGVPAEALSAPDKTGDCFDTGIPWDDGRQNPWGMLVQGTLYQRGDRLFPVGRPSPAYQGLDPGADFTNERLIQAWEDLKAAADAGNPGAAMLRDICLMSAVQTHSFHVGPLVIMPTAPGPMHLRDMWRPATLPDQVMNLPYMDPYFRALESRTYCVEFSMARTPLLDILPWHESLPDLDPSTPDIKVRGWYFTGDGIGGMHPLAILSTGYPMQIWGYTHAITAWVTAGFDVLALEHRGFGWSEGFPQLVTEDFFTALDQLESGVLAFGPDDDPAGEPIWRNDLLRGDTARTKPVILMGHAWGAAAVSRAMAMNYGTAQVDGRWDESGNFIDAGNDPKLYNFLGVITSGGWNGSPMFSSEGGFLDFFEGCCLQELHTGWAVNGEVWDSQAEWPACFRMVQTVGHYGQPAGAIRAYNDKLRGFKKVLILEGGIDEVLTHSDFYDHGLHEVVQWAHWLVIFRWFSQSGLFPGIQWPHSNTRQIELEEAVCEGPDPLHSTDWRYRQAHNWYEKTLKQLLTRHDMETHGVTRDDKGVFHVHAATLYDALAEMGYCVAEDRLWQMETYRRLARGRMAELFGPDLLATDIYYRTTGYSEEELTDGYRALDPESRQILDGYVAGINRRIHRLEEDPQLIPFEFAALGMTPQPWTPEDVLAWITFLLRAFDSEASLTTQVENTVLLQELASRFPADYLLMFNDLRWFNDPDALTILPGEAKDHTSAEYSAADLDDIPPLGRAWHELRTKRQHIDERLADLNLTVKMGSYAWAVSGAKTASGNPMLYSGPQMGFSTPSIVAEGAICTPRYRCSGMHVPGVPLISIGRSPLHAWALMVGQAHTVDIYLESATDVFLHRVETIPVAGGTDFILPVYRTSHGPVIHPMPYDPDEPGGIILGWRYAHWGYEFDHIRALFEMGRGGADIRRFAAGVDKLAASQHVLSADYQDNIAYRMAGRDPVRPAGVDPRFVQLGNGSQEWPEPVTLVPRPYGVNPGQGYFCGWNNKSRADYDNCQWNIPYQFGSAHRANLVNEILSDQDNLTFEQLRDQACNIAATFSCFDGGDDWVFVKDTFASAVLAHPTAERMAALAMLDGWDSHFTCCTVDDWVSGETLCDTWVLKDAWIREVLRLTFEDELDTGSMSYDDHYPGVLFNVLLHALADPSSETSTTYDWFLDQSGSGKPQNVEEIIVLALDNVLAELGGCPWDFSRWNIVFRHDFLGELDRMPWSNRSTYAHCLEIGPWGVQRIESLFPLGESGNIDISTGQPVFDPHFFSMQNLYRTFTHRVFPVIWPELHPQKELQK
ncbi:MAG: penicillin acylase family protein [Acidobacteria bacterium]|nr:penicillin acylase family protein [Acidobacteriota bacterium]